MNKAIIILVVLRTAFGSSSAWAQNGPTSDGVGTYGNLGFSRIHDRDPVGGKTELDGITARIGFRFIRHFGVEAESTLGIGDEEVGNFDDPVKAKLDHQLGVHAVGFLPLGRRADIFARVGYSHFEASIRDSQEEVSIGEGGLSLGLGGQYMLGARSGVRFDFTTVDTAGSDVESITISYVHKF